MLTCLQAAAFAAGAAAALSARYAVRRYVLRTRRVPEGTRARLVLLCDLHSEPSPARRRRIAALTRSLAPDAVLLGGDTVDGYGRRDMRGARAFLRLLEGLPVYACMGNHEGRIGALEEIRAMMVREGVRVLNGGWETLDVRGAPVVIAGIDDQASPEYGGKDGWALGMRRIFASLADAPGARILLAHRPEPVRLYASLPFDLVLSGHAHGGQVRLPGLVNGLYSPDQGLFPRHAGGPYRHGEVYHIVSRGLAVFPARPRVFNPPEIVVIDIEHNGVNRMETGRPAEPRLPE